MYATEIIERDVKGDCVFHVRQRLAVAVLCEPRKSAQVHPHVQISALDVRRGNATEIRSADFDVWDRSDNLAAAIPSIAGAAAVYLAQTGRNPHSARSAHALRHIAAALVGGDLIAAIGKGTEIGREDVGVYARSVCRCDR